MKNVSKFLILTVGFFIFNLAIGQDINQAGKLFNEAIELSKSDKYQEALNKYNECIKVVEQLGDEGTELKAKAEKQIPYNYYKIGYTNYKAKKFEQAIENYQKAITYSEKFDNGKYVKKSQKIIAGIYNMMANKDYKSENYDQALTTLDKAVEVDETYSKTYLTKAIVYFKMNDLDKMKENVELVKKYDKKQKNTKKAIEIATKAYSIAAVNSLKEENYTEAVSNLNNSLECDKTNASSYYYLALAYNKQNEFDKALESATEGLKNVGDDEKTEANIQFELGNAYVGLKKNTEACQAYKEALNGTNAEAAKYQMEHVLKCN